MEWADIHDIGTVLVSVQQRRKRERGHYRKRILWGECSADSLKEVRQQLNACGVPTRDRVVTIGIASPLYPEGLRRSLYFIFTIGTGLCLLLHVGGWVTGRWVIIRCWQREHDQCSPFGIFDLSYLFRYPLGDG